MKCHSFILNAFVLLFIFSCNNERVAIPYLGNTNIKHNSIKLLDTLYLDATMTSMEGSFFMDDSIVGFADINFASAFLFSINGEFIERRIGLGHGPKEVPSLDKIHVYNDQGEYLIRDDANVIFAINKNDWSIKRKGVLNFGWENVQKEVNPEDVKYYTINENNYWSFQFKEIEKDKLLFQVHINNRDFGPFGRRSNADEYFRESKTLGILNLENLKVEDVICPHARIFQEYHYLPSMDFYAFDVKGDTILHNAGPDSLIYVYRFPEKLLFTFGSSGKNMKQDYVETNTFDEYQDVVLPNWLNYGQYFTLKLVKKTGLLFRSYLRGGSEPMDGLQIYQDTTLIADLDVPKHFNVLGYYKGHYYAVDYWFDPNTMEEEDVFRLYRFDLK